MQFQIMLEELDVRFQNHLDVYYKSHFGLLRDNLSFGFHIVHHLKSRIVRDFIHRLV